MGKAWSIGRKNMNKADILLANDTVSKVHATISFLDGQYYLIDNGSTNGTYIAPNFNSSIKEHTVIDENDTIYFGEMKCFGRELIGISKETVGTEISQELIILQGKSEFKKEEPDTPVTPAASIKKTRCSSCLSIVFTNQSCKNCGSTKHMGEH